MEGRTFNRFLQVLAVHHMADQKIRLPLVLLIAARRAVNHIGFAVLIGHGGRQRCPGPASGHKARGFAIFKPKHLHTRSQAKPEFRDHRGTLQPPPRRGCGNHIAFIIDHIDMAGIARRRAPHGRLTDTGHVRFHRTRPVNRRLIIHRPAIAFYFTGAKFQRRLIANEFPALIVISIR